MCGPATGRMMRSRLAQSDATGRRCGSQSAIAMPIAAESGPRRAIVFAVARTSPYYSGDLSPEQISDVLAKAVGHWGSGAEYLMNTVQQLESLGIHDRNLWRLQRMVADRIASGPRAGGAAGHPDQ